MNGLAGKILLDHRSGESLTMQIVRQVEQMVREGSLKPGDQLPTVRELATELRINYSTVARAYKVLDEERIISTQRGRGTYIWDEPPPDQAVSLRQKSLEELCQRFLAEASRLGYSTEQITGVLTGLLNVSEPSGMNPAEPAQTAGPDQVIKE